MLGGSPDTAMSMSEFGRNSPRTSEPKTKTSEAPMLRSRFAAASTSFALYRIVGISKPEAYCGSGATTHNTQVDYITAVGVSAPMQNLKRVRCFAP